MYFICYAIDIFSSFLLLDFLHRYKTNTKKSERFRDWIYPSNKQSSESFRTYS
jgi:hypothetical protein